MKKMRSDCLAVMTVIITLSIVIWTGTAQASAEEDMFTATTQPDAMILLDLSGSMGQTPSGGTKIYGSSSACTANTTACAGISSSYPYSSNTTGTPDPVNCVGLPDNNYKYAHNASCTADTVNCTGAAPTQYLYAHDGTGVANTTHCSGWSDCSGGYCKTSHKSGSTRVCQTRRTICTGGFCDVSKTGCSTYCNISCSGGFCNNPKTGCDVDLSGSCSNGFCDNDSQSDCAVNCSKLAIAKRSIFSLLDDNNDGQITGADKISLGVRMGYMRFYNCSTSGSQESGTPPTLDYSAGCNTLIQGIDSPYSTIYCGNSTSCSSSAAGSSTSNTVSGESANGYTPLAAAQAEMKLYLDWHKTQDAAAACRSKFVIFVTDGADTISCNANGSTDAPQRRESVAKAKALADAGYKVFVIGFGAAMPADEKNTLNWMAYYGRTDDPNTANTGDVTSYSIPSGAFYPSGLASCSTSTSNDPGTFELGGYAYIAADADQLAAALRSTISIIRQANYSFSQASIQASRTTDENFLYEGSFEPGDSSEPFWKGHLKKYQIISEGTSEGSVGAVQWDAGTILRDRTVSLDSGRNILTRTGGLTTAGALEDFKTTNSNITYARLGVTTEDERKDIIGYIQGVYIQGVAEYNPEYVLDATTTTPKPWKLGDVFRSTPITVGTPSTFFHDIRDCNKQFDDHYAKHPRTSANGKRLIVVGANDGQSHAFKTSDGTEAWSFIPPNLLSKLKNMTHPQHPANQSHQYFDDGPITVADVWGGTVSSCTPASCNANGRCKDTNSWKTIMVFAEGRGAIDYAWSSSDSCDTGLSGTYSETARAPSLLPPIYYCGYHALDLTDSLNPAYMWHLKFDSDANRASQAPYIGDPWSKMMTGRVRYNDSGVEKEKWVGFIGAGYNGSDCTGAGACDTRGKGFFVVDLKDGKIFWSFTKGVSNALQTSTDMKYSLPASPAIVDTDGDGFIDTAYLGDLGGNMWRFTFCRDQDMPNCAKSNWSGGKLFDATAGTGNSKSIYTSASVATDELKNIWVYWGTGNKIAPTAKTGIQEYFYGLKDGRPSTPYNADSFTKFAASSTTTYSASSGTAGFRMQLAGSDTGEKVLADPTVFGGVVYFTTYTPSAGTDACNQSGTAKLYGINYTTAAGIIPTVPGSSTLARSKDIGSGIPSAPVISMKPGSNTSPDLYVTTSGTGGGVTGTTVTSASTQRVNFDPPSTASRTNMLYWRDNRIQ
jgi:Tfp pilus tip-associated adhesin PilY1